MAHLVEKMAYIGQVPWHGLGARLPENTNDIEIWRREAGLDWSVVQTPVLFRQNEQIKTLPERSVLYRSDTGVPLSIMSKDYKVVQPSDVLEFYRDLCENQGFQMHTAGSLNGGKRIWALAEVGKDFSVKNDQVGAYLLLATSMDGTLATRAMFTSIRVVCNNTLSFAYNHSGKDYISIRHNTKFNPDAVKEQLGFEESWKQFQENVVLLSDYRISRKQAEMLALQTIGDERKSLAEQSAPDLKKMGEVLSLFNGNGIGSDLQSAQGTAWGFVNAVTQYVDHSMGRNVNTRMNRAWFGGGKALKDLAMMNALALAA